MEIETSINHPDEVVEDTQDPKEEVHTIVTTDRTAEARNSMKLVDDLSIFDDFVFCQSMMQ